MWLNFCNFVDKCIFMMKQKSITFLSRVFGISSILVLVLICLCSSSAFGRVLTKEEVANFMLNGYNTQTSDATSLVSQVENRMATWQTIADLTSQYEGNYSIGYNYRTKVFFFVYYTGSTNALNNQYTTSVMFSNNNAYIGRYAAMANNLSLTYNYYNYDLVNDNLTNSTVTNGSVNNTCFGYSNSAIYWIYTDRYISYSTSFGISAHGQKPTGTDLFAENFVSSEVWSFTPSWNVTVNLSGDNTVDYRVVDPSYIYTLFGLLQDSSLCTGAAYDILAYNKTINTWESVYSWGDYFDVNNPISNYFSTGNIDGIPTSSIKLRSNLVIPDTIITFYFNKGNEISDLSHRLKHSFYIRGSQTVITSSDVIDYDSTFSDPDYYNAYQDSVNDLVNMGFDDTLNDVNNNITDVPDSSSIVNEYFTNSGELASQLGYYDFSGDNPYGNVFLTIIDGLQSVLLDTGAVTLTCTVHNQTFTFNSNDFQNNSTILKVFTSSTCIFLVVYTFYYLAFVYVHKLSEGDIWGLKNAAKSSASIIAHWM